MLKAFLTSVTLAALLSMAIPTSAAVDVYEFSTPDKRDRYLRLIEQLRCPKCQNQNLAGSDSPIATDLRRELFRLLEEGKSDKQIKHFMVERYGDYVLYLPPVQRNTLLLYWGPPVIFGLAVLSLLMLAWRRQRVLRQDDTGDLSPEDAERLHELLAQESRTPKRNGGKH